MCVHTSTKIILSVTTNVVVIIPFAEKNWKHTKLSNYLPVVQHKL